MSDTKFLYLICNPNDWHEDNNENYKVNEILYNLKEENWRIGNLKNVTVGMQGIIKVSKDIRPMSMLKKYGIEKIQSGIYGTYEVIKLRPDDNRVNIRIIDNFFHQNRIIDLKTSKKILGETLFNAQGARYIKETDYKNICKAVSNIPHKDESKPKKDLDTKNTKNYPRDEQEKQGALFLASYKCEIDESHITFISKSRNQNYVEGHHLVPISQYDKFEYDLDVKANIVSLCPTCHRKIHFGIKEDVSELLEKLYHQRIDRLKKAGIIITVKELKNIYL